jgi:hypothetical protein
MNRDDLFENPSPNEATDVGIAREVRYSLPELLRELKLERNSSVFAREILDQVEIAKIIETRRARHGKGR